jgi:hypothetical protein
MLLVLLLVLVAVFRHVETTTAALHFFLLARPLPQH